MVWWLRRDIGRVRALSAAMPEKMDVDTKPAPAEAEAEAAAVSDAPISVDKRAPPLAQPRARAKI